MKIDENYIEKLCNTIAKTILETFENLSIEDVNMYQFGYNKAIDDFKHQMEAEIESSAKFIREYDDSLPQKAYHSGLSHALKIAEQLKKERN